MGVGLRARRIRMGCDMGYGMMEAVGWDTGGFICLLLLSFLL